MQLPSPRREFAELTSLKCSLAAPHLRLTLVPPGQLFTVTGIPGVPRLDLTRGRFSFICTRTLSLPAGRWPAVVDRGAGAARMRLGVDV